MTTQEAQENRAQAAALDSLKELIHLHKLEEDDKATEDGQEPIDAARDLSFGEGREIQVVWTLAGGGPGVRVRAMYDPNDLRHPSRVLIEHQDWLTPWVPLAPGPTGEAALEWFADIMNGGDVAAGE